MLSSGARRLAMLQLLQFQLVSVWGHAAQDLHLPETVHLQPTSFSRTRRQAQTGTITDGSMIWTTGGGSNSPWSVTAHSPLLSYCATYDLCTTWYAFDGTEANPTGRSVGLQGPNSFRGPWVFTIDMGSSFQFTHYRVAGSTHYSFGDVELRYLNAAGRMVPVPGSAFTWDRAIGGLQSAAFAGPITARVWQVYKSSHSNPLIQSRFQLYLTEVQFGTTVASPPATTSPTTAAPTKSPMTSDPTTASPTTVGPTTPVLLTSAPTTPEPTTSEPTTASPATSLPTTPVPTASPVTTLPTTAAPTVTSPTTPAAQQPTAPTQTPTPDEPVESGRTATPSALTSASPSPANAAAAAGDDGSSETSVVLWLSVGVAAGVAVLCFIGLLWQRARRNKADRGTNNGAGLQARARATPAMSTNPVYDPGAQLPEQLALYDVVDSGEQAAASAYAALDTGAAVYGQRPDGGAVQADPYYSAPSAHQSEVEPSGSDYAVPMTLTPDYAATAVSTAEYDSAAVSALDTYAKPSTAEEAAAGFGSRCSAGIHDPHYAEVAEQTPLAPGPADFYTESSDHFDASSEPQANDGTSVAVALGPDYATASTLDRPARAVAAGQCAYVSGDGLVCRNRCTAGSPQCAGHTCAAQGCTHAKRSQLRLCSSCSTHGGVPSTRGRSHRSSAADGEDASNETLA